MSIPGIDHGDGDVGAASQHMRLGQAQLGERILRGIALAQCGLLLLQQVTEIRLHRPDTGVGAEFAAYRCRRTAVGDAEQADRGANQRKILRLHAHQAMAPRQLIGLRVG